MTSTINIFDNLQCIIQASQCVHSWMCYLSKASDNNCLLAESSIRYPFVECLERHQVNDVQLEKRHPVFQGKRMDVYIGKKDRNDDDNNFLLQYLWHKIIKQTICHDYRIRGWTKR